MRNVIRSESCAMEVTKSEYFRTGNEFRNFSIHDFLGLNRKFKSDAVYAINSNDNVQSEYSDTLSQLRKVFNANLSLFHDESSVHQSVLEKVITPDDFIVMDELSNTNLKIAVKHLNNLGVKSENISGNDLEKLSQIIISRSSHGGKIWFAGQSIYPVPGRYFPLSAFKQLMDQYSNLHLFIDDSYSLGWSGIKGEGFVYSNFANLQRVIIVTSLTKGLEPIQEHWLFRKLILCLLKMRIKKNWSISNLKQIGRIADLLNSNEISSLQMQLSSRIKYFHKVLKGQLPCVSDRSLPLCYLPVHLPGMCQEISAKLIEEGFYIGSAMYPHAHVDQPGLKINITLNNTENDIKKLIISLKNSYSKAQKIYRLLTNQI